MRGEQTVLHPQCSQGYRPCLSQDPIRAGYIAPDSSISTKRSWKPVMHVNGSPTLGLTHFVHHIYTTKDGFGDRMQLDAIFNSNHWHVIEHSISSPRTQWRRAPWSSGEIALHFRDGQARLWSVPIPWRRHRELPGACLETEKNNIRVRERVKIDLTRTWARTLMVAVGSSFSLSSG